MDRWTAAQPEARAAAAIPQPPPPHPPRNEDKGLAQPTGPLAGRLRLWVPRATGAPPAGGAPLRQPESPQTATTATPEPLTTLHPTPNLTQPKFLYPTNNNQSRPTITFIRHCTVQSQPTSRSQGSQIPLPSPSGWSHPAGHLPPGSPATSAPSPGSCPALRPGPTQPPTLFS